MGTHFYGIHCHDFYVFTCLAIFVRDDRAAYDPECADQALAEALRLWRQTFVS
jgi:hypothetical protein